MTSKSVKIVAVGFSMIGLVACGKGMGEKNQLKVSGKYEAKGSTVTTLEGVTTNSNTIISETDKNIETRYEFSKDNKGVEITKQRLIVKGGDVIGTEEISSSCSDSKNLVKPASASLRDSKNQIRMTQKTVDANGKEADLKINFTTLKSEGSKELLQKAKTKEIPEVCLDEDKKIVALVDTKEKETAKTPESTEEKKEESAVESKSSESTQDYSEQELKNGTAEADAAKKAESQASVEDDGIEKKGPR